MASNSPPNLQERELREDGLLLPRCLALILRLIERHNNDDDVCAGISDPISGDGFKNTTQKSKLYDTLTVHSGIEVFKSFVYENKFCSWDPHLQESICKLKYLGYLYPHTLMVGGRGIYIDTVRNAWERKVLQPPCHFRLHQIGEVHPVPLDAVSQAPFMPLPETLCLTISQLCRSHGQPASLDVIIQQLGEAYQEAQQPSEEVIYHTLGNLLKERKVHHHGFGYSIIAPETYHVNGCVALQDNRLVITGGGEQNGQLSTICIPLIPPAKMDMRSISCQTEQEVETTSSTPDDLHDIDPNVTSEKDRKGSAQHSKTTKANIKTGEGKKVVSLERSHSLNAKKNRGKKVSGSLSRSSSVRFDEAKSKEVSRDINLNSCHQDKDKGQKTTLLGKLFGRKKKKNVSSEKRQVEYITFSAQFPPPEWEWYRLQQDLQEDEKTACGDYMSLHGNCLEDTVNHYECPPTRQCTAIPPDSTYDSHDSSHLYLSGSSHTQQKVAKRDKFSPHLKRDSDRLVIIESRHSGAFDEEPCNDNTHQTLLSKAQESQKHISNMDPVAQEDINSKEFDDDDAEHLRNTFVNRRDPFMLLDDKPQTRRSKVFRKYRELQCKSFPNNNDITIQYNGHLSMKNTGCTKSRDSGVNCIGLRNNQPSGKVNKKSESPIPESLNNGLNVNKSNISPTPKSLLHSTPKSLIHSIPEHSHEDSGFNSPKTADYSELVGGPVLVEDERGRSMISHPSHSLRSQLQMCADFQMPDRKINDTHGDIMTPADDNQYVTMTDERPSCGSSSWSGSLQTVRDAQLTTLQNNKRLTPEKTRQSAALPTRSASSPPKLQTHDDVRRKNSHLTQNNHLGDSTKHTSYGVRMPTVKHPGDTYNSHSRHSAKAHDRDSNVPVEHAYYNSDGRDTASLPREHTQRSQKEHSKHSHHNRKPLRYSAELHHTPTVDYSYNH